MPEISEALGREMILTLSGLHSEHYGRMAIVQGEPVAMISNMLEALQSIEY